MNSLSSARMISFSNLTTGYSRKAIGHGLSAYLTKGQLTALIGTNGVGKSTLLRTLTGLQPPLGGDICLNGKDLRTYTPRTLAQTVSVVLTYRPETDTLTAAEVVRMGRIPYRHIFSTINDADNEAVERAMQLTHTALLAQRTVNTLSDGERQRVFIAKALAQNTPIIVLDEPTAFLDFGSKVETFSLLRQLAREEGKTVLLSTHDVEMALRFADNVWLLSDMLQAGSPEELSDNGQIAELFNIEGLIHYDAANRTFSLSKNEQS